MLVKRLIDMQSEDWNRMKALYVQSFPEEERSPLELLTDDMTGISEILGFYEDDRFCGFACMLIALGIAHIIYIAIEETERGSGYGSRALEQIRQRYPGHRIVVDMEEVLPDVPNFVQREKRQRFYLRNGYAFCPVSYEWRGDKYRILSQGGSVSEQEFWNFWEYITQKNEAFCQF
ncbi:MAG: GNAT family N-acetyltransferase [Candidatus Merdivicinus sp.]|jgi:GNAT superfamily N-acetyltransferase